jgi:hypothetical protein
MSVREWSSHEIKLCSQSMPFRQLIALLAVITKKEKEIVFVGSASLGFNIR